MFTFQEFFLAERDYSFPEIGRCIYPMKCLTLLCVVFAGLLVGADAPPEAAARAALQSAREQQRGAVQAGTSAAREKQRQAISLQLQSARSAKSAESSFFVLPPLGKSVVTAAPFAAPPCDPMPKEEADNLMQQAAARENLSVDLLRAVINQESGFRPCAVSPKGAMGLMQLMPSTFNELGKQDPFDPRQNIDSGARFLKQLLTRYGGDVKLALGAYNAGPARVDASGGVPEIEETLRYVQAIMGSLPR
jgi:soluble lytic murein transglycosylase-like protein